MPKTPVKKKKETSQKPELRTRKAPKYASFKLSKKIPHPAGPLPSAWKIAKMSLRLIAKNKKTLLGISVIYVILNLILVRGFAAPINIQEIKTTIQDTFGTTLSGLSLVGVVFGSLLGGSGSSTSETASLYQTLLFIIVSLAVIWVYRQSATGSKTTTKQSFYNGMYPLIPFVLVILVLMLQLLPAYLGGFIYNIVSSNGLAVTAAEKAIWILIYGLLILLSIYMICSSLFATYIVTLPNVSPMQALRSSRELVFSRRLSIFLKLLAIPVFAIIVLIIIVVPAIYFLPAVAPWLYFVLSTASIVFLHAYLFSLYKELL